MVKTRTASAIANCPRKAVLAERKPFMGIQPADYFSTEDLNPVEPQRVSGAKFEFLIDKVSYKDKPRGKEMSAIRHRLSNPDARVLTDIKGLEVFIGHGYTIMPAICEGGTRRDNWTAQQLFLLDFDNDDAMRRRGFDLLEPVDALQRAFDKHLDPLLLYFSHSATVEPYCPKYRMVFSLENPSSDFTYVERIGRALLDAFPEADPCSVRPTQMFLSPGKEVWECWKMR